MDRTPIIELKNTGENRLFIKREDLIPYSFGGNKARKAELFFHEIDAGGFDTVVTYGSSHSNHCRVVANMCCARGLGCVLIGPEEVSDVTYNSRFMQLFGAEIITVPVDRVHSAIESKLAALKKAGKKPYFIPGGGHGDIGTEAYVQCYDEIAEYERETGTHFHMIFFASGTGTTQAGLVCGKLLAGSDTEVIGISIARKNPRGRNVVLESVRSYLQNRTDRRFEDAAIENATVFLDCYTGEGYGQNSPEIAETIVSAMRLHGLPLDSTYTAKAFLGMKKYLAEHGVSGKNILFIHTGGTPLFFDDMDKNIDI